MKQRSRPRWPASLFVHRATNYFFFAVFLRAPVFFAPAFFDADFLPALFFFMGMVQSPELEWNTRSIPRWIVGWATARREGARPIRYALELRARLSVVEALVNWCVVASIGRSPVATTL